MHSGTVGRQFEFIAALESTLTDEHPKIGTGRELFSLKEREALLLAPYAMHSMNSAGRAYPETDHPYRGPFQRDRDRILHSSAFRRLSGKTQVFTGNMGDYHRTRLTHTMEVASIARTIGRALRLNEDLIEALALLHDIGHPPFGHAGEDALAEFLSSEGGFSHNRYAITLVQEIERPYPGFEGLNLSKETLEGQACRADKAAVESTPLLEVQVVDVADNITYDAHDTDDAVKLELLRMDELMEITLIRNCSATVKGQFGPLSGDSLRQAIVHELINCQVLDVLADVTPRLRQAELHGTDELRISGFRISPSDRMSNHKQELEDFLYRRVYRHPELIGARRDAQRRLRKLAEHYTTQPRLLPANYQQRCQRVGVRRSVVDYVAGMTDRFCLRQFDELVGRSD